jgi:L-fuconolactonase
MRLDSHQHFWRYDEAQYPWIPKGSPLHRDWLPADLAALQEPLGIDGSIAVQARQTLAETSWLLQLADENPRIRGVVGWVDLRSDRVEEQIARFASHPKFRGVRHVVQDEPDDEFMLGAAFQHGIGKLRSFGLTYDILIYPTQMKAAVELIRRFPEQPFVLDHVAKPQIRDGILAPWRDYLLEIAQSPNVLCKVSGMVTEADHLNWKAEHFTPYLDVVFEAFGPQRLMWGSDWPVCLFAAKYEETLRLVEEYSDRLDEKNREALFGGNAAAFYGV